MSSFQYQVTIPYAHGQRKLVMGSVKQLTRRSFQSLESGLFNTPELSIAGISQLAAKIRSEMKYLSSDAKNSILRDTVEAVKNFSLETLRVELNRHLPIVMSLLSLIVNK